jgi:hypothetical protein
MKNLLRIYGIIAVVAILLAFSGNGMVEAQDTIKSGWQVPIVVI